MTPSQSPMTNLVTVYLRPGCPFCAALRRRLRRSGLSYEPVDIWRDPSAAAAVRAVAGGNETVPTVRVGPRMLVNPSLGEVLEAVAEVAPDWLPLAPQRRGRWRRRLEPRRH